MTRRDRLFHKNLDLAERIAKTFCRQHAVRHWAFDDIHAAAMFGLLMAARRSNTTENEKFRRFACKRIKGSISDWSRGLYNERRLLRLRHKHPGRLFVVVGVTRKCGRSEWEEEYIPGRDDGSVKNVDDRDQIESMRRRVPAELRGVFDDMAAGKNQKQIAARLGVGQSRIGQIVKRVKEAVR